MELTLVGPSIEPVLTESGKDFLDVGRVLLRIVGVYQDIIQVYDYGDVNHIGEDVVHEPLETCRGVGEPLGHHQPLERPVPGPGGFPFVAIGDADEVVGMLQVDFGVDPGLSRSI